MAAINLVAVLALGAANCSCNYENWIETVKATEALAITKPRFIVPKEAVEKVENKTCAIITFEIDERGVPINIKIEESSRSRVVDMAAKYTVEKYRFSVKNKIEPKKIFALYFEYPGKY
ncbi:energy transducer TonB [Xanthomonas sp. CFBP 8703]|uniref:Energy transducer TonB n=1 Tax=Xanthomonas bonasiae TaxID=2810351 RepID=A0ABS3AWS9_9XANT|nr:energy transducer TonB [Xanthomonas bonasiae]MBN6100819.1 energy transducer TonB [Xanthomonas bonasiae]